MLYTIKHKDKILVKDTEAKHHLVSYHSQHNTYNEVKLNSEKIIIELEYLPQCMWISSLYNMIVVRYKCNYFHNTKNLLLWELNVHLIKRVLKQILK